MNYNDNELVEMRLWMFIGQLSYTQTYKLYIQ